MTRYFDTSALAKVHLSEEGTGEVRELLRTARGALTSIITLPELTSALHRAVNRGRVRQDSSEQVRGNMATLWRSLVRVPIDPRLIHAAEELVWRYRLRGFDGVHLASALSMQTQLRESVEFVSFDGALRSAALGEGLAVSPVVAR
ncbi:MAG: type II toxin-antitoxin system VapC family toxin [Dehalococcoidia bacterium]